MEKYTPEEEKQIEVSRGKYLEETKEKVGGKPSFLEKVRGAFGVESGLPKKVAEAMMKDAGLEESKRMEKIMADAEKENDERMAKVMEEAKGEDKERTKIKKRLNDLSEDTEETHAIAEEEDKEKTKKIKSRVQDVEEARAMAEAGDYARTREAYLKQVGEILDKHNGGEGITRDAILIKGELREELEGLYNRSFPLTKRSPDGDPLSVVGYPYLGSKAHRYHAENSAEQAERLEYWGGVLHRHPVEGKSAKDLFNAEREFLGYKSQFERIVKVKDEVDEHVRENGVFSLPVFLSAVLMQNGKLAYLLDDSDCYGLKEKQNELRTLSRNPATTIDELASYIKNTLQGYADKYNEKAVVIESELAGIEAGK